MPEGEDSLTDLILYEYPLLRPIVDPWSVVRRIALGLRQQIQPEGHRPDAPCPDVSDLSAGIATSRTFAAVVDHGISPHGRGCAYSEVS